MVQIKGHRHRGGGRQVPWPRKQIPKHREGHCPYCKKPVKNIEEHIRTEHKQEKQKPIKGKIHGHD